MLKRKDAYELIKNINSPFLQKFLYFTAEARITHKAEYDFFAWATANLHSKKDDITFYKNFIAMMLQAVVNLYNAGYVHLDLKPENFLLYIIDGKIYLILTDFDEVIKNYSYKKESNKLVMRYRPPEFKNSKHIEPTGNLKPFDVYCLGVSMLMGLAVILPEMRYTNEDRDLVIKEFADRFKFDVNSAEHWKLIDLIIYSRTAAPSELSAGLKNLLDLLLDPAKRWDVTQAMASPFFGDSAEARQGFFNNFKEQAEQDLQLKIDNELHTNPEIGNAYWLLHPHLKVIYQAAKKIDNKIQLLESSQDVQELGKEIAELHKQIETFLSHSGPGTRTKAALNKLLQGVSKEEDRIKEKKIIPSVPAYTANPNTQWNRSVQAVPLAPSSGSEARLSLS